jgi:hypothetical protein
MRELFLQMNLEARLQGTQVGAFIKAPVVGNTGLSPVGAVRYKIVVCIFL